MKIRSYVESTDYEYLEKWVDDEKVHTMWCANHIPYPLTKENLHRFLEKNTIESSDGAYVAVEDDGRIVGFFCYVINVLDRTGFLKCIIVDRKKRGTGCGKEMLKLVLQYAFDQTGVDTVQLNVFDENAAAKHCYKKVGFVEESVSYHVFPYKDELWSRCHMIIEKGQFIL